MYFGKKFVSIPISDLEYPKLLALWANSVGARHFISLSLSGSSVLVYKRAYEDQSKTSSTSRYNYR